MNITYRPSVNSPFVQQVRIAPRDPAKTILRSHQSKVYRLAALIPRRCVPHILSGHPHRPRGSLLQLRNVILVD